MRRGMLARQQMQMQNVPWVRSTPTGPPVEPEPPKPRRWVRFLLRLEQHVPWLFQKREI